MTIDYRKMFLAIIAAVIIAIPTAMVFQNHNQKAMDATNKANQFQIDVKKKDSELKKLQIQTIEQKKADDAEKLKLQQENEQLKKDLQAKRDKQASDAKLAAAQAASGVSGNCETYRPLVQKYFGAATAGAMIVMSHESGCNPNAVSDTNDHGLFQLNGIKVYDPEENIRIAYQSKFVTPRRGTTPNFSAWYAVCTPNLVPKYAGIWCS